jgi:thioredoxin reductase
MANHPTGFNSEKNKPLTLPFAEAIKKSGARIKMAPNGGFHDLSFNDACIGDGKADMIAMGHAWLTDWEYGRKAYEGRGDDVTPCIMCNKCHGLSTRKQWYSVCSVNPKLGIGPIARLIDPPGTPKKVAVIGGGPAGMKAALTAAERGHQVTLYEGSDALGGQMRHADSSPIKWPLREYKDFLIRQVKKSGIEVLLGTLATPGMIRAKGYDVVMAATGAQPMIPDIPGVKGRNVVSHMEAYGQEKKLGKNIVLLNGGDTEDEGEEAQIGIETGIFLAQAGHSVTVLTGRKELLRPYRVHYPEQIIALHKRLENFSFVTEATVTGISDGSVSYTDGGGAEKTIGADAVVVSAGRQARREAALSFSDTAGRFFTIGDCNGPGSVQTSIRSAFFAASQI